MAGKHIKPIEKEIIVGSSEEPLMVLEKYQLDLDQVCVNNAYSELLQISRLRSASTWGYYPELVENDKDQYPHSHKLGELLYKLLISKLHSAQERSLDLAFIKMSEGGLQGCYGGLHVDVTTGVGVRQYNEKNAKKSILRSIINLHKKPRILSYVEMPKNELQDFGVVIKEGEYHPIDIPDSIAIKSVEIPEIGSDCFWQVKFWSSIVLHVGLTNENGHFVAGFGRYVDRNEEEYSL